MPETTPKTMNPTALPVAAAAQLLTKVSGRLVSEEALQTDVEAGAPTNADGTLNLVNYAAWLVREAGHGD